MLLSPKFLEEQTQQRTSYHATPCPQFIRQKWSPCHSWRRNMQCVGNRMRNNIGRPEGNSIGHKRPSWKNIGSNKNKICIESVATETVDAQCLAVLYFGSVMDAIEICDTDAVTLPLKVEATNLGFGVCFTSSASDNFPFRDSLLNATITAGSLTIDGCRMLSRQPWLWKKRKSKFDLT